MTLIYPWEKNKPITANKILYYLWSIDLFVYKIIVYFLLDAYLLIYLFIYGHIYLLNFLSVACLFIFTHLFIWPFWQFIYLSHIYSFIIFVSCLFVYLFPSIHPLPCM